MKMSRKKIVSLILILILLLVVFVVVVQLGFKKNNPIEQNNISEIKLSPDAISIDERRELGISEDVELEVINRGSNGEITTYRLLK